MKEQQPISGEPAIKPNQQRHADNLSKLHGEFYHGTYYFFGEAQPHANETVVFERRSNVS